MFPRMLTTTVMVGLIAVSGAAWSYDAGLAEGYAKLFAPVQGAGAGKALHLMPPEVFVDALKSGEPMIAVDIRTPAEMSIFTTVLPGSLAIPLNELFAPENLDRLPVDQKLVVFCATGARAIAAGTALRYIGFDNVYVLKGGFKALMTYLDPKTANAPLKKLDKP
jgi:rhodanese-related sulfurtransferase